MSILKFAYIRGAQNALVSSGAIQPYANEYKADLAVKLAALAIGDDSADNVDDEELAQALAAMSSNAEEELSPEEQAQVMAAAGEGQEELQELMAGSSEGEDEMDEEAAREVVAYLKSAAAKGHFSGGAANPSPMTQHDFETEAGARANAGYANMNGRQGLANPKKNATPFTAAQKPLVEGAGLDAKTAAAILRKLSADAANTAANELGGAGLGGTDEEHEGGSRKSDSYANNSSQGNAKGDSNATPNTGKMTDHSDNVSASMLDLNKESAYNFLLYKTAEEVGPFLPQGLTESDKLAALRTMIGMTQPERAEYIQRVKWAMEDTEDKEDKKDEEDSEGLTAAQKKLPEHIQKAIKEENEEKKASYILRKLGLGR
jgi:hypothetical protein